MNPTKFDVVKEVDCDYITATASQGEAGESLYSFGHYLVRAEISRGAKVRASRAGGYSTTVAGSCSVGRRHDGVCVRGAGHVAAEHWQQITDLSENVTRLDLQVTTVPPEGVSSRLRSVWAGRNRGMSANGRPAKIKAILGPHGCETIMVGSRQSQRYGRFYDKHTESGIKEYLGCLRWELELKGELARSIAHRLTLTERYRAEIAAMVVSFVKERGKHNLRLSEGIPGAGALSCLLNDGEVLQSSLTDCCCSHCQRAPVLRSIPEVSRGLAFIGNNAKPTVQRLIAAGYGEEVIEQLGLTEYLQRRAMGVCVLQSDQKEAKYTQ